MSSKKLYYIFTALLIILGLGSVGMAYGANTLLTKRSQKLADAKAISESVSNVEAQEIKNKKDIATYSQLNTIAQTIVPQDKDQAEAVREIVNLAIGSGIHELTSINFPASTLGATSTLSTTTGTSTLTTPSTTKGLTQVIPVKGISGVYDLQITVSDDTSHRVDYSAFTTFLQKLEQNRRTAQVSAINIQPDPLQPSQIAFTLTIDEFIKP